jgi:TonB-dependent SusC/RagA subfamily outer membrane receptor
MQKIQLAIPEPCHENWHAMTPTEQGRFCNSCAKEVVDISMMTDTEVLTYFSALTYDKVCGRVLPSQLNRNITMPKGPKKKLFWYWNYIVMFFMFFSKSNIAKSQNKENIISVPIKPARSNENLGGMEVVINGTGLKRPIPRIVKGRVVSNTNLAIPFAAIKHVGSQAGVNADQNGFFELKIKDHDRIEVSAMGFYTDVVEIAGSSFMTIVLRSGYEYNEVQFYAGKIKSVIVPTPKYTAIFKIKDSTTGHALKYASIVVSNMSNQMTNSGVTDEKGAYQLIRATKNDSYDVRITAEGYQATEFTISAKEFNERKKAWEVFMKRKELVKPPTYSRRTSSNHEALTRLGAISTIPAISAPIYVLDGLIIPGTKDIDPNNIENIVVLKGPDATALFGSQGANGAIVMTSKTSILNKVKDLDTVKIISYPLMGQLRTTRCTSTFVRTSKPVEKTQYTPAPIHGMTASVYPNPVQRGKLFAIAMQLKETGEHRIQIADVTGRIVLQKQVNAVTIAQKEMIGADSRWGAGIYYVSVINKNGQPVNQVSFIVQ